MDEDVIEENFHSEMEYIADVTLAVQARAANKVEGIALREGKRSRRGGKMSTAKVERIKQKIDKLDTQQLDALIQWLEKLLQKGA